jgi:mannose-6-phosphate isomerase-like protein (cupin superfamily)
VFLRKLNKCKKFISGDKCILREYFNPLKDEMELNYSLAHATVKPKEKTLKHKLKSTEVYFILKGKGVMEINKERKEVKEKDVIYVPPNCTQRIKNTGRKKLEFLCIVEPAWKKEDEKIIEKIK